MFGARQFEWLKNALLSSTARIKLIANGTQMWNRVNRYEGFNHYATEQKALADFLVANRDRWRDLPLRRPTFLRAAPHRTTGRVSAPRVHLEPAHVEALRQSRRRRSAAIRTSSPGTYLGKRQFGMIRVSGPANNRVIALESFDAKGELLWRHEIRARDLAFPKK